MPSRKLTADDYWLIASVLIAAPGWILFDEYERAHPDRFSALSSTSIYLGITASSVGMTFLFRKLFGAMGRFRCGGHKGGGEA
jgi:hypothetical protein